MENLLGLAQHFLQNNPDKVANQAAELNPDSDDQEHYKAATEHVHRIASDPRHHQALDDDETSSAEQAHRKIYPQGHESAPDPDAVKNGDPDEVGGAIFAQVLKGVGAKKGKGGSELDVASLLSSGNLDMATLLPVVLSQASKVLGQSGASDGLKGQVMQKVAVMAFKSQFSGGGGGGGLASLASKFL